MIVELYNHQDGFKAFAIIMSCALHSMLEVHISTLLLFCTHATPLTTKKYLGYFPQKTKKKSFEKLLILENPQAQNPLKHKKFHAKILFLIFNDIFKKLNIKVILTLAKLILQDFCGCLCCSQGWNLWLYWGVASGRPALPLSALLSWAQLLSSASLSSQLSVLKFRCAS